MLPYLNLNFPCLSVLTSVWSITVISDKCDRIRPFHGAVPIHVIATVENGMVHAIAAGMARITVKTQDGGYTAECVITVNGNLEGEASF